MAELGERYGIAVDPRARVWQLSVGEQQRVEILKALYREARILILDEPTAVLTPQEAEGLFVTLRSMAAEGRTVIFISHKLHEVMAVADRVTVLRGGRSIGTVDTAGATSQSLAALMVGRDVDVTRRPERASAIGEVILEVEGLSAARRPRRGGPARRSRCRCARARCSASPASRATGSASSPRRSPACGRSPRAPCGSAAMLSARAIRARRSRPGSRTCRRTGSIRASRRASASRRTSR